MELIGVDVKTKEMLDAAVEVKMLSYGHEQVLGLKSLPDFSRLMWGYGKGQMVVVGARTSMGKTAFMLQNAYDFAKQGYKVIYLSLEMSEQSLGIRNFCREKKVNSYDVKRGGFASFEIKWKEYKKEKADLGISDCLGRNWKQINKIIEDRMYNKPDVIFIDHINEIRSESGNDKQVIDDYLINLRAMAVHNNITFVVGAQINRIAQDEKQKFPMLHHLKATGKLEETADVVILLHWPHYYDIKKDKNDYLLIIAKNREGVTCPHEVRFFPEFSLFTEKEKVQKEDYHAAREAA